MTATLSPVAGLSALRPFEVAGVRISNPARTRVGVAGRKRKRWVVDVDGTLLKRQPGGRGPYDWDRVIEDEPNVPVVDVVRGLAVIGKQFLVVSGRLDVCRDDTRRSLQHHVFRHCSVNAWNLNDLFMRDEARRAMPDDELKRELFLHNIMPFYDIEGVIDDRQRVVDMWRREGLFCMQVAEGNF